MTLVDLLCSIFRSQNQNQNFHEHNGACVQNDELEILHTIVVHLQGMNTRHNYKASRTLLYLHMYMTYMYILKF